MYDALVYSLLSVLIVRLLSFIGALSLVFRHKTLNIVLIYFVGFSAGALLGDAFLHLLPESAGKGFTLEVALYVLIGIVFSFIIEKVIHWHHCHNIDCDVNKRHVKPLAYMNLLGDGVHNFIDGVIIAGSYMVSFPIGLATTLAVVFHEIPQELGDFAVLVHGGYTKRRALFLNFLSALTVVVGGVVGYFVTSASELAVPVLLPFAAGSFLLQAL